LSPDAGLSSRDSFGAVLTHAAPDDGVGQQALFHQIFSFVPVCPEVGCGLPIPRESMRLEGSPANPLYASAQFFDFLTRTKNPSFPNKKRVRTYPYDFLRWSQCFLVSVALSLSIYHRYIHFISTTSALSQT
jgi:hypothetical protein